MWGFLALLWGCGGPPPAPAPTPVPSVDFNTAAARVAVPLVEKPGGEVVRYWSRLPFDGDIEAARALVLAGPPALPGGAEEQARLAAVRAELDAARVTLVETDLRDSPDAPMVGKLLEAAEIVEAIYALQRGTTSLFDAVPPGDLSSRALFARNQGPACVTGQGRAAGPCSALRGAPRLISGLYPEAIQTDGFCDRLSAEHPDVMTPFVVARDGIAGLGAVPYSEAWPDALGALATALEAAADLAPADEGALAAYLRAAAKACRDNDWFAADAAWLAMKGQSRWYLRVGPDEVYEDPCGQHAQFALTLARIDPAGVKYQDLLAPVKQDMERLVAELAGPPYAAREVGFHLPEFVQITLNAADSRAGVGATVGQSLPNWGPVSESGGRTIAMTNMGVDPAAQEAEARLATSLVCADTWAAWPRDPEPTLYSTILHEAGHNLGPSGEYRVDGKIDSIVFGGPHAAVLEELKCQQTSMFLAHRLPTLGIVQPASPSTLNSSDIAWAIGQIPDGMYSDDGAAITYAQVAAIQLGAYVDAGAIVWRADQLAADGSTPGCLAVDFDKLPAAIDALTEEVFALKAQGDVARAEALFAKYVDGDNQHQVFRETLVERTRSSRVNSYVYRVVLE